MKNRVTILLIILFFTLAACEKAIVSSYANNKPDVNNDPEQELVEDIDQIIIANDSGKFIITPIAEYSISARVVSSRSYSRKWTALLSPVDLALVWGKLGDKKTDNFISYKQRNRWYYYRYNQNCPIDNNYIISHSSNNHIIPSSYNLSITLKSIKKNDLVRIEGYLVKVDGFMKNGKVYWGTSTTRNDSGDRSCELIYAKSIQINDKIYR